MLGLVLNEVTHQEMHNVDTRVCRLCLLFEAVHANCLQLPWMRRCTCSQNSLCSSWLRTRIRCVCACVCVCMCVCVCLSVCLCAWQAELWPPAWHVLTTSVCVGALCSICRATSILWQRCRKAIAQRPHSTLQGSLPPPLFFFFFSFIHSIAFACLLSSLHVREAKHKHQTQDMCSPHCLCCRLLQGGAAVSAAVRCFIAQALQGFVMANNRGERQGESGCSKGKQGEARGEANGDTDTHTDTHTHRHTHTETHTHTRTHTHTHTRSSPSYSPLSSLPSSPLRLQRPPKAGGINLHPQSAACQWYVHVLWLSLCHLSQGSSQIVG